MLLHPKVAEEAARKLPTFSPRDVSNLTYAFAHLFRAITKFVTNSADQFETRHAANLMWAYGKQLRRGHVLNLFSALTEAMLKAGEPRGE